MAFILTATLIFIYIHRNLWKSINNINLSTFVYLVLISIVSQIFNGLLFNKIALKFGILLKPIEWIGLPFTTAMGNYITPFSGGIISRAVYLKYRYTFPYARFLSVIGASQLVFFGVAGTVGTFTVIFLSGRLDYYFEILIFFVGVVFIISTLILVPVKKIPGNNWLVTSLNNVIEGWILIKKDYILLTKLAVYTLTNIFLNGFSFWLAFNALCGTDQSFGKIFLISLFSSFSILFKLTPGNLGFFEVIISFTSGILGVGVGIGLMVSLLMRCTSIMPIFTLGPVFSFMLTRELSGEKFRNDN